MKVEKKNIIIEPGLAEEIKKRSGENVFLCYQCKKCAAGCPNRKFMDASPTELMRKVQLGMTDDAMKDNTIWYCLSCQTCTARCPQDIDIAHVVDTLRIIVQEKGVKADTKNSRLFNMIWMKMLRFTGRIYEVALTGTLNTFTGKPFKDIGLGVKMIMSGKLKLFPSIKRTSEMIKMFKRAKKLKK